MSLSLRQGLLVGLAQSLALAPGVSRSGITISAGRFLGLDPRRGGAALVPAARPDRVRRGAAEGVHRRAQGRPAATGGWGRSSSARSPRPAAGLLAINWLLGYVRRHDYTVFVVYRLVLAAIILLVIATGAREATF